MDVVTVSNPAPFEVTGMPMPIVGERVKLEVEAVIVGVGVDVAQVLNEMVPTRSVRVHVTEARAL